MPASSAIENEQLLEFFFAQSTHGFFFMMLDEPVEWGEHVDKEEVLDYVFEHQRMTKVNSAIVTQFNAASPEELLGRTPAQFFAHDLAAARARWMEFFDQGYIHTETAERRLDGTPMCIEGDYMIIRDDRGRIVGHFGIQRDITEKYIAHEELHQSRERLRALACRLETVREEERTDISREIHDELGQALTGLKLDIAWMKRRLPSDHAMIDHCASILERIDHSLNAVRRIATELRPSVLDQLGLAAALEWQGHEFAARTGIDVAMDIAVDGCTIPDQMGTAAFRILQESLTNIARHAQATHVDVRLTQSPTAFALEVSDNGIGFPPRRLEGTSSLGVLGMRERALACGGDFSITCQPGRGTTVLLRVPLSDDPTQ